MPQNIVSSYMVSKDYELLDSIKELDSLLNNDPSFKFPDGETLKERIRKGKNFVPYQFKGDDELRFLPSRTVGYRFSMWSSKNLLDKRDGRETTKAINSLLGNCHPDSELEQAFRSYCQKLGVEPVKAEKIPRKYWQPLHIDGDRFTVRDALFHAIMTSASNPYEYPKALKDELEEELKRLSKHKQESLVLQKHRNCQKDLRDYLLTVRRTCEVTGITTPELLVASHIQPWAECDFDEEKLDPYNVLLLSANFDKLFDQGLISFTDDGKILISASLSEEERPKLGLTEDLSLINGVPVKMKKYLKWHRENWFRK